MTPIPRIAVIIGSTREGRLADKPARWIQQQAQRRGDMQVDLLDLRNHPLPFYDEKGPIMRFPTENPAALRWQQALARYDGFIFVVAEYNHSITGVLKNALDSAYKDWCRKPFTAIGYGGNGAARAVEHLRLIGTALQMVSTSGSVHITGGDFMAISPMGADRPVEEIEAHLLPSTKAALDELLWWTHATMPARTSDQQVF